MSPKIANPTGIKSKSILIVEKFASRFSIDESGCWLWHGYMNKAGYGTFGIDQHSRMAHRVMWELVGNEIDPTLQLDHICEVKNCVNPEHLRQVTARENMYYSSATSTDNRFKTHCAAGHKFTFSNTYRTKLNWRVCKVCRQGWVDKNRFNKKQLTEDKETTE